MKISLSAVVLLTLLVGFCLDGLVAAHQRCKACKRKHPPPRGIDCPFVETLGTPEEIAAAAYPTCRTCKRPHSPPRGSNCHHVFFDDVQPDPFMDDPADLLEAPGPTGHSQVLLSRLSSQITEMNDNVLGLTQRVRSLEHQSPARAAPTPPRDVQGLEGGIRSRLQALDISSEALHDADDDWEVAGAGAPPPQGKQLKSGAFIPAQHDVIVQLDYPHKHVLRGAGRPPPLALNLTMSEFVLGYTVMLESPTMDANLRGHMLKFLKLLMEDANVRPWQQVRHYHMTIIQCMETGQLQWGDVEGMLSIQRQHSRTFVAPTPGIRRPTTQPRATQSASSVVVCVPFQTNNCESHTDHDSPRGFVQHVCGFCLRMTGRAISSHSEQDCRRKKNSSETKNDQ